MSDYDQWRRDQQNAETPINDAGGEALFWVLVVVVALGVFVFANFIGGSVRSELSAPKPNGTAQYDLEKATPAQDEPAAQEGVAEDHTGEGISIGSGATFTSSD